MKLSRLLLLSVALAPIGAHAADAADAAVAQRPRYARLVTVPTANQANLAWPSLAGQTTRYIEIELGLQPGGAPIRSCHPS
jgi:hypothetical protein